MRRKAFGNAFVALGVILVIVALVLAAYNIREAAEAAKASSSALDELFAIMTATDRLTPEIEPPAPDTEAPDSDAPDSDVTEEVIPPETEYDIPDYLSDPSTPMPTVEVDGQSYVGVIEAPSVGISLPVIDKWSYAKLKKAPCRYVGSAYTDDIIIMAHNFRSHFGQIGKLRVGDTVYFTDMNAHVFEYEVVEIETLVGTAVEEMRAGEWDLTLFTCTIGGRSRVTVRCVRVTE